MNQPYGPWATLITAGQNPQLSDFWRRRMHLLVPVSQASPAFSRRNVFFLVATAFTLFFLPTIRPGPADAQQQPVKKAEAAGPAAKGGGTTGVRVIGRVLEKPGDKGAKGVVVKLVSLPDSATRSAVTDDEWRYVFDGVHRFATPRPGRSTRLAGGIG